MPQKFYYDFLNERIGTIPTAFAPKENDKARQLAGVVAALGKRPVLKLWSPKTHKNAQEYYSGTPGVYFCCRYETPDTARHALIQDMAGKGVDLFAVVRANHNQRNLADNFFALAAWSSLNLREVRLGARISGKNGSGAICTLTIGGTTELHYFSDGNLFKQGALIGMRLRIENVGAQQEIMYRVWNYESEPEPSVWRFRAANSYERGLIDSAGVGLTEYHTDEHALFLTVSGVEIETGTESAPTHSYGRLLVPVEKW